MSNPEASSLKATTQAQEKFAAGLALIAGYIDAYAFLHYKTYVSFMSGNTTQLGSLSGEGEFFEAIPALLAIIFFVIGVFSGTLLAHYYEHRFHRLLFGIIAILLAAVISITMLSSLSSLLSIAILSLGMGLMNTAITNVGAQSVNTAFVTGTLNRMAKHFALAVTRAPLPDSQGEWDTQCRRAFILLAIWATFLIGAFLGGMATLHLGITVLFFPVLILTALSVLNYVPR